MKGRLGYDNVNTSIQEFNAALEARYAFLAKGFQAMASMALKKRYKVRFSVNWRFDFKYTPRQNVCYGSKSILIKPNVMTIFDPCQTF